MFNTKKRILSIIALISCISIVINGQQPEYNWDWKKDGYILGSSALIWSGSQLLKSRADKITAADIARLNDSSVWFFDRGAIKNYSVNSGKMSNYILYGSAALPFIFNVNKRGRKQGWKIAGMAIETFFITDGTINLLKASTKRFRPFTYNPDVPDIDKLSNSSRYSFASGHVSTVASMSFFSAKIFSDLYPNSKWKKVVWAGAISLPAITGYLRYKAGKHFPTDIIAGYGIGAFFGYLVPKWHLSKATRNVTVSPLNNGIYVRVRI